MDERERFEQVAVHAGVFVWEIDGDGVFTYLSSSVENVLGYVPDELVGRRRYCDLFPPAIQEEMRLEARKIFDSGTSFSRFNSARVAKDGRLVVVESRGLPVLDKSGNVAGYRGADRDVTDQKRAEAVLRETRGTIQAQLDEIEAIYKGAPVGLCVMSAELRFQRINQQLADINGLPVEQHLGRTIGEVLPDFSPVIAPLLLRVLHTGKPVVDVEIRGMTPARPGVERVWLCSFYPLRSDAGNTAVNVVVQEITERKRAEAALVESEERFRSMADSAPVIIWMNDAEGGITFLNKQAAAFSGWTPEQLLAGSWFQLLHPDDIGRLHSIAHQGIRNRSAARMDFRLRRHDGEYRWMIGTAMPRFAGGAFAGHIGSLMDFTELKRDQEQVLAAQKLESLGVLAGGIAHDFNNLLGSILADAELIAGEAADGSSAREAADRICRVTVRASHIVRELMAYAGRDVPEFQPVVAGMLLAEMEELLQVSISKSATLELNIPADLPPVRANAAQLRQIVVNLVTNASEAIADKPGTIRISASSEAVEAGSREAAQFGLPEGDYVRLEVSDTGCGMSDEVRSKILDPFYTTKFPGRGLGLAAVYGIVRRHGGAVHVVSDPGRGTEFSIFLPVANEPLQVETAPADRAAARARSTRARGVLLIEDEESLRVAVCKVLRKNGFSVIEIEEGAAALEIFRLRHKEIGVVLLDLTLPGLSGREILVGLRRLRPNVRVIVTTAYSEEKACATLGGREYWSFIRKPYHLADLMRMLSHALN